MRLPLQSFSGQTLTLPDGSQVLTPRAVSRPVLASSELVQKIQKRVLADLAAGEAGSPIPRSLLLLLPDKTRRQTASRLALDALLGLCEQNRHLSLTVLFGLGTHPLMTLQDIAQILGTERQSRLTRLGVSLHQQTTLDSLPQRWVTVPNPLAGTRSLTAQNNDQVTIGVPEMLWQCDLILVAGDTDLHPYEGRAGSGGIHKMIAIGVGCLSAIRLTHSMEVLTHPLTRQGEAGNQFVALVDHLARTIIEELRPPKGKLMAAPIGISVVARQADQPEAFWIGACEEERAVLMKPLELERTMTLQTSVDFVVADTEHEKGTDLLAGARSLHFLCNFDDNENQLLCRSTPLRTALLFNACHEVRNAHGIGNTGTMLHLQALKQFAQDAWQSLDMPGFQSGSAHVSLKQRFLLGQTLKRSILDRWELYLHLVSEEDEIFASLDHALAASPTSQSTIRDVLVVLDQALPHSFGAHRHVIAGTRQRLLGSDVPSALAFLRQATDQLGFKGLGEGGQRALRLLAILRNFDQLLVATDNPVVLDFLEGFSSRRDLLNAPVQSQGADSDSSALPCGLIGLLGISLQVLSPQDALDGALRWHRQLLEAFTVAGQPDLQPPLRLAFLQQPVILRR
jgi:hypothetical protein